MLHFKSTHPQQWKNSCWACGRYDKHKYFLVEIPVQWKEHGYVTVIVTWEVLKLQ